MSLLLAAIILVCGLIILLSAPDQMESKDQRQLEHELKENAELLKEEPINENTNKLFEFTAIGDSVMLGAAAAIKEVFPGAVVDAKESRQVWDAKALAQELDAQGKLLDIVIIALGGNGSFSKDTVQELVASLGSERIIYWIAPYGKNLYWTESSLNILHELEKENENMVVLNWPEIAAQHGDWFYDDGMHLNEDGQAEYANFLLESIQLYEENGN